MDYIIKPTNQSFKEIIPVWEQQDLDETIAKTEKPYHNTSFSKKILIGTFALALSINPLKLNPKIISPEYSNQLLAQIVDNRINEMELLNDEINSINNCIHSRIDMDEDEVIELGLITAYLETVKEYYKEQLKPFEL